MAKDCDELNTSLKHGIVSDAKHDFGLKPGDIDVILSGTDESICPDIPERGNRHGVIYYDEDNLLFELLNKDNDYGFDGEKEFNKKIIETLIENDYDIELRSVGYNENTYAVSLLHYNSKINLKELTQDPRMKNSDIRSFFNDREYSEQNVLIDCGAIDFLNLFHVKNYNINCVINREKLNDPSTSSKIAGKVKGISYLIDDDDDKRSKHLDHDGDVEYYHKNNYLNKDKFFSKYYFYLSTPKRKEPRKSNSDLYTRFLIMPNDTADDFETELHVSKDWRENSINACISEMRRKPKKMWPVIYQRKRAGDWLMVLSCFDTDRRYINDDTGKHFNLQKTVIKTIDRILLWYALLLGADVLYEAEGSLLFFRNKDRKRLTSSRPVIPRRPLNSLSDNEYSGGGSIKTSKELCEEYLSELKKDLECLETEENSDYGYYEKVAFIILSCLNEYRDSTNVYEQMQAIAFDILPSIEGYIKCEEPDIIQFFSGDHYTADCTSYAARNIALHTLGLRTGSIEKLGNREKYSVRIPSSAVDFYKKIEKHLEKSTFEERRNWLIEQLNAYHSNLKLNSSKKAYTRKTSSGIKMSKQTLITAGGSRKTRRKSRN